MKPHTKNTFHWLFAQLPTQLSVLVPYEARQAAWYFVPSYWTSWQNGALSFPSLFGNTPLIVVILWATCLVTWVLLSNRQFSLGTTIVAPDWRFSLLSWAASATIPRIFRDELTFICVSSIYPSIRIYLNMYIHTV